MAEYAHPILIIAIMLACGVIGGLVNFWGENIAADERHPLLKRLTSTVFHISTRAEKPRGLEPCLDSDAWLLLDGEFDEPIRDVRLITLSVHSEEEWRVAPLGPPHIGSILQFRPQLQAIVGIPVPEFDSVWSLATSGHLKFVHFAFTEPHRSHSFIVSVSFSSKSEVDET